MAQFLWYTCGMTPIELKAQRERLGLTQMQLANKLGVTANTVARWERGERTIPKTAVLLLKTLKKPRVSRGS